MDDQIEEIVAEARHHLKMANYKAAVSSKLSSINILLTTITIFLILSGTNLKWVLYVYLLNLVGLVLTHCQRKASKKECAKFEICEKHLKELHAEIERAEEERPPL